MKQIYKLAKVGTLALATLLLSSAALVGAQSDQTSRIEFERGSTTTEVDDAVVRGTRNRYLLRANAGQTMTLNITSTEDNAVFDVYPPGSSRTLGGGREATDWSGELPRSGDYVIVVSSTRGNAEFKLKVEVY